VIHFSIAFAGPVSRSNWAPFGKQKRKKKLAEGKYRPLRSADVSQYKKQP